MDSGFLGRIGTMARARHVGLGLALAAALAACSKVPLVAPSSASITLTAGSRTLATGASTGLTALVSETNGSTVQNGTLVRFTTTLGHVDPTDATTRNGVATTTFFADGSSGVAEIRATSGAAGAGGTSSGTSGGTSGGTTTTTTSSNVVQITIGAAAAKTVLVTATPSSDGSSTIVAAVIDANGNRLAGVQVVFSTDAGSLSATSAVTDANGEARVQLTTSQAAKVTATAGSASGTVTVNAPASLSLAVSPNPGTAGQAVTLTVTPSSNTTSQVTVDWGDGTTNDLGFVSAAVAVTHAYASAGTFTIKATGTTNGQTRSSSITEVVNARLAINVTVSASPASPAHGTPVTFTATVGGDTTASVASYHWVITNGSSSEFDVTTTGNTLTETFASAGTRTIAVTVTTTDGRSGNGQTQILVQ